MSGKEENYIERIQAYLAGVVYSRLQESQAMDADEISLLFGTGWDKQGWFWEIAGELTDEKLILARDMVPRQRRVDFWSSRNCVRVLKRAEAYMEVGSVWDFERAVDLEMLAEGMVAYMDMMISEEVREWLGSDKDLAWDLIKESGNKVLRWSELVNNEESVLPELIRQVPPADILALFKLVGDKAFSLMEMDPEYVKVMGEYARDEPGVWSEKLVGVVRTAWALGFGGVEARQIDELLWKIYKQQHPGNVELPPEDFGLYAEGTRRLRKSAGSRGWKKAIRHLNLAGETKSEEEEVEYWREKLRRWKVDWLEDPRHPVNHLRATIGYEIESDPLPGMESGVFDLLDIVGITRGVGDGQGTWELSPGPFYHPRTAEVSWMLIARYGLIDTYDYYNQTFHLNLGVANEDRVSVLVRILQATGYAYKPRYDVRDRGYTPEPIRTGLKILTKSSAAVPYLSYVEAKEFNVWTNTGVAKHLRTAAALGTTLKNYQSERKLRAQFPELAGRVWVSEDQRRLARVWQEAEDRWREVLAELGIPSLMEPESNTREVRRFAALISEAFPNRVSRYHSVTDRGEALVKGAREIGRYVVGEVEEILGGVEKAFLGQFEVVKNTPEGKLKELRLKSLFHRYPCGIQTESAAARRRRLEELIEIYSKQG